ncbi:hypothetical protein GGR51DRAFT_570346 [Nemania sp. FL0031]|nr:hypothetical protein GGR51DRAFT_570346 [Nemania sp. FL0031]
MAYDNESRSGSTSSSEAHAQLLYESLEQYNQGRKRRRPSVILGALIVLFLSSACGIILAIVLMAKVAATEAVCLSRDLLLFAGVMSLLYICLHIRGARKNYKRVGPGPPQIYGNYLHASALLVARLGIVVWITALVATAIMIARAIPLEGFLGKVPILNLLICIGALPAFLIISVTIERNTTPFATAALSSPSLLAHRVIEYTDDISSDMSVSRQSSLKRKGSKRGSVVTLATEEIWAAKYNEKTELRTEKIPPILPKVNLIPSSPIPPVPKELAPTQSQAVPQPVYFPGGWRAEWNNVAEEVGVPCITEDSIVRPSSVRPPPSSIEPESTPVGTAISPSSSPPTPKQSTTPKKSTSPKTSKQNHRSSLRPPAPSTSIASSAARSNLSTVRYAAQPEIAVRQPITVVRNPAYQPPSCKDEKEEGVEQPPISKPDPVALLRNAQRAQKAGMGTGTGTGTGAQGPKRKPSNFSRPTQSMRARSERSR